jgi:branched-chain amino acid transport system ATP-binding protein
VSVVLVEQNSRMALRISSYAYVLETGRVALSGPSAELVDNDHVRRLYLGG